MADLELEPEEATAAVVVGSIVLPFTEGDGVIVTAPLTPVVLLAVLFLPLLSLLALLTLLFWSLNCKAVSTNLEKENADVDAGPGECSRLTTGEFDALVCANVTGPAAAAPAPWLF